MKRHGAQIRLTAKHAQIIRRTFNNAIDADEIAKSWDQTHPAGGSVAPQIARDWARIHITVDKSLFKGVFARLYADGWVLGDTVAKVLINEAINKAVTAPKIGVVNWDTWKPGNQAAAQLLSPKGGLQALLDSRAILIDGITNTKLDRIGTVLAQALDVGATPKQVSILVDQVVNDPQQALVIAQTEMSRAVVQAELAQYQDSGVEMLEWLVADPCDDCQENLDASPIGIDESWPNGDAPVHPNCMCDIAPYIVTSEGDTNG